MERSEGLVYINEMLERQGIVCNENTSTLLYDYYSLLSEKNKVMNLTRITDFKDAVIKHFIDSLIVLKFPETKVIFEEQEKPLRLADIGSGAGIPGFPLKIACPYINVTSIDSVGKKVHFQNATAVALGLRDFKALHARIEDLAHAKDVRGTFDICTFRAVSGLSVLCEYGLPLLKKGGTLIAYKASGADEEVKNAQKSLKVLGGKIRGVKHFNIEGAERSLVVIEKMADTPKKYPRKAGTPVKSPL